MNRKNLVTTVNHQLRNNARRTRARAGAIAHYFLFYNKEIMKIRCRNGGVDDTTEMMRHVKGILSSRVQFIKEKVNRLRSIGRDEVIQNFTECLQNDRIITEPLYAQYRQHCRSSPIKKDFIAMYNTDLVSLKVLTAFLASLEDNAKFVSRPDLYLSAQEQESMDKADLQWLITEQYITTALLQTGVSKVRWTDELDNEVRFLFYLLPLHLQFVDELIMERFKFPQWKLPAHN